MSKKTTGFGDAWAMIVKPECVYHLEMHKTGVDAVPLAKAALSLALMPVA